MRPNEVTGSFMDVIGVYVCERLVISRQFGSHSKGARAKPRLLTHRLYCVTQSFGRKADYGGYVHEDIISSSSSFSIPNAWLDKLFSLAIPINSDDGVAVVARFITQRGCVQC